MEVVLRLSQLPPMMPDDARRAYAVALAVLKAAPTEKSVMALQFMEYTAVQRRGRKLRSIALGESWELLLEHMHEGGKEQVTVLEVHGARRRVSA